MASYLRSAIPINQIGASRAWSLILFPARSVADLWKRRMRLSHSSARTTQHRQQFTVALCVIDAKASKTRRAAIFFCNNAAIIQHFTHSPAINTSATRRERSAYFFFKPWRPQLWVWRQRKFDIIFQWWKRHLSFRDRRACQFKSMRRSLLCWHCKWLISAIRCLTSFINDPVGHNRKGNVQRTICRWRREPPVTFKRPAIYGVFLNCRCELPTNQ